MIFIMLLHFCQGKKKSSSIKYVFQKIYRYTNQLQPMKTSMQDVNEMHFCGKRCHEYFEINSACAVLLPPGFAWKILFINQFMTEIKTSLKSR